MVSLLFFDDQIHVGGPWVGRGDVPQDDGRQGGDQQALPPRPEDGPAPAAGREKVPSRIDTGAGRRSQIYCSEDLGAFYLDVLKDRLYTTAPGSLARRSAQTALWQITQAMLHWMAPFLSFTAEEAWGVMGAAGKTPAATRDSIFMDTYTALEAPEPALLAKWARLREIREAVNKEIEALRAAGQVGSSLQAQVTLSAPPADLDILASLGADLKFVFITSAIEIIAGDALSIRVSAAFGTKCERCWHYSEALGTDPAHPTLCGRCTSNLFGAGETRHFA